MKRLAVGFRQILAEFTKVTGDDAAVQLITDSMANSLDIQIEYEGSGWRTVTPYGWNTSAAGDLLVMCYKDGMEIRSYRLDRVIQLYVNDVLVDANVDLPEERNDPESFVIPQLPDIDAVLELSEGERGADEPFAIAVDELETYRETGFVDDQPAVSDVDEPDESSVKSVDEQPDGQPNKPVGEQHDDDGDEPGNDSVGEQPAESTKGGDEREDQGDEGK